MTWVKLKTTPPSGHEREHGHATRALAPGAILKVEHDRVEDGERVFYFTTTMAPWSAVLFEEHKP
jgi:hypothetical protein